MRTRLPAAASALLLTLSSSVVLGQQLVCKPGKGCTIEFQPPPAQWQSPTVQGGGQVQVDPQAQAQAQWQAELARRARWEAYFQWRAQVAIDAQASINVRPYVDQMKVGARLTPDPYASMAPPTYAAPGDASVHFPRVEMGLLTFCYGAYTGHGEPIYLGWCPALRYRMNRRVGFALDPAVVKAYYGNLDFAMFGLRPGVELAFAQGKRDVTASHAYAVAGLDAWFPFKVGDKGPTAFLGGHVGLGAVLSGEYAGIGFEVRGLVRGGVGTGDNETAAAMSTFRVGFEARAPVIYFSFP